MAPQSLKLTLIVFPCYAWSLIWRCIPLSSILGSIKQQFYKTRYWLAHLFVSGASSYHPGVSWYCKWMVGGMAKWDDFHTFVSGQLKTLYSTWSQFEQVWQCCVRTNLWQSNSFCNFLLGVWQRFRCLHCKNNQLHCKNNQKQCCVSYSWVLVIFLSQWTTHVLCWTYLMIPYKNNPLFSFSLAMIRAVWRNCTWFANSMVVMVFLDRVIQSDPRHY